MLKAKAKRARKESRQVNSPVPPKQAEMHHSPARVSTHKHPSLNSGRCERARLNRLRRVMETLGLFIVNITDVSATTGTPSAFTVATIPINPGQATMFPWLSAIASRFESYRFNRLRFLYETEAATTLGGTLVLAVDYDASDNAPATKQQALAYKSSVRSAPWAPCELDCEGGDLRKLSSHYVRQGGVPSLTDRKLYDQGNLFVISQNVSTASALLGELYVEYDVELLTPVYDASSAANGSLIAGANTVGQAAATPFGTAVLQGKGGVILSCAGALDVLVDGLVVGATYLMAIEETGTVITVMSNFTTIAGLVTEVGGSTGINAAATSAFMVKYFTATARSGTLAFSASTATTVTRMRFYVAQVEI